VLTGTVVVVTAVVEVAGVVEVATPAVVEEVADDVVIVVVTLVARGREPEQADAASITTDAAKAFGKRRPFMLLLLALSVGLDVQFEYSSTKFYHMI
jgi:hypothetical protein